MHFDSYDNPETEALLRAAQDRAARRLEARRERITHAVAAGGYLAAATALAVFAPWERSFSVSTCVVVLAIYVAAHAVRFPAGGGWTVPTQLVFVPMLFLLPTPLVPLVASLGGFLARTPDLARRRTSLARALAAAGDDWFALGPALVIVLAGAQSFGWAYWPVYVAALAAQISFDLTATAGRYWFAERIRPAVHLPPLLWIELVDAALSPVGLLIAVAATPHPGLLLLTLPLIALFAPFAHERGGRLEQVLALNAAYRGTALLLGDVIEADDEYTGDHSRSVLALSLAVAEGLGVDATQRRNVEFAALLHDVGKIRIPKAILNKPGALEPEEWAIMRCHTIEGEAMLRRVGGALSDVGRVVRATHERYDGAGYPDGLGGEAIPLEARIISVCDAYSAITTSRPYRRAQPAGVAMAELVRCAGSQFDPSVVAALRAIVGAYPIDEAPSAGRASGGARAGDGVGAGRP
jgi:HD-GYP domain-containing protein (c-di-GMP phosphodiesterase class II)